MKPDILERLAAQFGHLVRCGNPFAGDDVELGQTLAGAIAEIRRLRSALLLAGGFSDVKVVDLEFCPSCNSHHVAGNCT